MEERWGNTKNRGWLLRRCAKNGAGLCGNRYSLVVEFWGRMSEMEFDKVTSWVNERLLLLRWWVGIKRTAKNNFALGGSFSLYFLLVQKKAVPLHPLSGIQHLTSTEGRVLWKIYIKQRSSSTRSETYFYEYSLGWIYVPSIFRNQGALWSMILPDMRFVLNRDTTLL